ncbi:hypothetical protein TBK1r_61550 [Stieleria magnilauensis]|uniref:G-patch domain-containing protein n=1 Tax=Stieleria magnilauensis TaxID=2527963 RepID=A0ABX5XYK6_9BACT|nr:hypothetical protein TBK1r_61550 [Planctomycetes bacterium TBK1r]
MIRGRMMKMGWGDGETRRWGGSVQNSRLPPHYSATYRFATQLRHHSKSLSAEGRAADSIAVGVVGRGVQAAGQ